MVLLPEYVFFSNISTTEKNKGVTVGVTFDREQNHFLLAH